MQVRVLGSSGGIGQGLKTTSILVDDDILLDAGTGVGELQLEEMQRIKHVFLSHSHLDHIASIPLLVDTLFNHLTQPLVVHGLPETIQALKQHIFNWVIWPDFSELPDKENPVLMFKEIAIGEVLDIDGRQIEVIEANHSVPAVAYRFSTATKSFAFSGDTTSNDEIWNALNNHDSLDVLIVECAFPDSQLELSKISSHYCPSLLAVDLEKLQHKPRILISHTMPSDEPVIMQECRDAINGREIELLNCNDRFVL